MPRSLTEQFIARFALPLLHGAEVTIGRPLGLRGAHQLTGELADQPAARAALDELSAACQGHLLALGIAPPAVPRWAEEASPLRLLLALHDLLFLARPEAQKLRPALRTAILSELIAALPPLPIEKFLAPDELSSLDSAVTRDHLEGEILLRHALIEPLFRLRRHDVQRKTWLSESIDRGLDDAHLPAEADGVLVNTLCWLELPLVVEGQGERALQELLAASPLTTLWQLRLPPAIAGAAAVSELRQHAPLLRRRYLARILCRRYVELGLSTVAEALSAPLLALLQQAVRDPEARQDALTWLGVVAHLHWLAFILFPDRVGFTSALPEGETPFFALFASLWATSPGLVMPADLAGDSGLHARAGAHAERCRAVVPPILLQHLQQLLTRALARPAQ